MPVNVTTGGVASRFTVVDAELDIPPPFVAVQVRVVPGVSALMVVVAQPDVVAMPDSGSVVVQLTVTSLVYQPLAPRCPLIDGVTTGDVVSGGSDCQTTSCGS